MTAASRWQRCRQRGARMLAVARIEFFHLIRDRTTIALVVTVPAIQILLFGYAVNLNPQNISIAIARDDGGPMGHFHQVISDTGYFVIQADQLKSGEAERMVRQGQVLVGVELPARNSSDPEGADAIPRIIVDATDPTAVRPALAALETAYWQHIAQTSPLVLTPTVDVEWLYNPDGRTAWVIVPGLAGVVVMISMLMLGALTLVRERERGSWETLLATPVDAFEALVGKLSPYVVIGTIQAVVVLGVAWMLFDLPMRGSLWALLLVTPLYALAHLILGFAFSALADSQLQAIQGAVFFYLPSMLLSGFMFPFQGMPTWAQSIGEMFPLTHFVRATRGVLLKGAGFFLVVAEMLPVVLFMIVAMAIALAAYRRRID